MLNRTFKIARMAAMVASVAVFAPSAADAQMLNMDMSWAFQTQANNWNHGMNAAAAVANKFLRDMQVARANGYTGPTPTVVTNQSLQASINGMNQAFADGNKAWHGQSERVGNAINNWTVGAIQGQAKYIDPRTGESTLLQYYSPPGQVTNSGGTYYTQDRMGQYWKWIGNEWMRMDNGW